MTEDNLPLRHLINGEILINDLLQDGAQVIERAMHALAEERGAALMAEFMTGSIALELRVRMQVGYTPMLLLDIRRESGIQGLLVAGGDVA